METVEKSTPSNEWIRQCAHNITEMFSAPLFIDDRARKYLRFMVLELQRFPLGLPDLGLAIYQAYAKTYESAGCSTENAKKEVLQALLIFFEDEPRKREKALQDFFDTIGHRPVSFIASIETYFIERPKKN